MRYIEADTPELTQDDFTRLHRLQINAYASEAALIGFPPPPMTETLQELIAADLRWLVAVDAEYAGAIGYTDDTLCIDVDRLFVGPQNRRQGVASTMLQKLLAHGRPIAVMTPETNEPARLLYESLGFAPIGRDRDPRVTMVRYCHR
jgi:GNAT superfamily N-acetyltransferase